MAEERLYDVIAINLRNSFIGNGENEEFIREADTQRYHDGDIWKGNL